MGQLLFKKCFWDAIRDGSKRTTIRRWKFGRLKPGGRAFSPGLGWLAIEAVDIVELNHLTDVDARADGFETLAAMKRTLDEIYPSTADDGKKWFRVAFHVEPAAT